MAPSAHPVPPLLVQRPAEGVHVDPAWWNELDGFSPGAAVLFSFPDLDLPASGASPITDIESSLAEDAPARLCATA